MKVPPPIGGFGKEERALSHRLTPVASGLPPLAGLKTARPLKIVNAVCVAPEPPYWRKRATGLRYDNSFSMSAIVRSLSSRASAWRIASASERFCPCSSAIFSSTESRQMRR